MADEFDIDDFQRRMDGALTALTRDFSGLRTGRASTALLDSLRVDAYGSQMPLDQLGTVSAPEARMLTVQVWDAGLANAVEKCIRESELGLNPQKEGQVIRIP
ncbi:MAG: ribosome-recycling factor, partial [Alphaproteobacteria bacterium]